MNLGLLGQGWDDPRSAAIMALAGGLLQGNAGMGLLAGSQAFQQAQQAKKQGLLEDLKLQEYKQKLADEQEQRTMQRDLLGAAKAAYISPDRANAMSMGPMPDGSNLPQISPGMDTRSFLDQAFQINPFKAMEFQQQFDKVEAPIKLSAGDSLWDPRKRQPIYTAPNKDDAPSAIKEYNFAVGQGYKGTFEQWDRERKNAGAPSVEVRVDNKMGESLAGQVGPMARDSRIQADGAVKMFDAADRIEAALNSNKVQAGPMASQIQTVRQFAQVVGGGNDEGIRQTRQVIKSLAQMSVEARKQLQGQGQVTESEAAAVAKADAGDINDLTVGELRDLVTLTKRAAHFTARGHADILQQLGSNPGTASLVPFYRVPRMDILLQHKPTLPKIGAQPSIDDILNKYPPK